VVTLLRRGQRGVGGTEYQRRTAVGVITWLLWDMFLSKQKKPTFLGAINGMLCGLVAITPSAVS